MLIKIEDWNTLLENKNVVTSVDIFNNKINDFILSLTKNFSYINKKTIITSVYKTMDFIGSLTSIRVREKMYNKTIHRPFNVQHKNIILFIEIF